MKQTLPALILMMMPVLPLRAAQPAIIGHRGASFAAPENTVSSIKEAWKEGADGTELDIYLTKDGKLVTIHDATTKRTTDQDLPVQEHTLEELRALDAGSWKGEKWKGEKIATLEESLAAVPAGKLIYIEIKGGPEVLPALKVLLDASPKPKNEIFIIDFKIENLIQAKTMFPDIRKLWIVGGKTDKETKQKVYPPLEEITAKAVAAGMDGLDLNDGFPLDAEAVAKIKGRKLILATWTVDDPGVAARLAAAGVDAITTNKPAFIRSALEK